MSCHRIGLGMNSVVEKSIEMFENEEIGLNIGVMGMRMKLLPVLLIVIVVIV